MYADDEGTGGHFSGTYKTVDAYIKGERTGSSPRGAHDASQKIIKTSGELWPTLGKD